MIGLGVQNDNETPSDKLRNLMLMTKNEESPMILPFEGFRERILAEKARSRNNYKIKHSLTKEKKSLSDMSNHDNPSERLGEERSRAHFRKFKNKVQPVLADYNDNKYNMLDKEILSNALKNYKTSFYEKSFPFEYGEFPERRVYIDDDGLEFTNDVGSGEFNSYPFQGNYLSMVS